MKTPAKKIPFAKSAVFALISFALTGVSNAAVSPGNLPLFFEAAPSAQFLARGRDFEFLISPDESQIILKKNAAESAGVRVRFVGANARAQISGARQLAGKVNYLIGNDPAQWRSGAPTFGAVRVAEIYPGVNLIYHGNQQRLEYDFDIAPGANPEAIRLQFDGADKISVNAQGELVLKLGNGEIRQPKPEIFQIVGGERKKIEGGYKIIDGRTVAFQLGEFDRGLPLVIDPVLGFSTYFGGNAGDSAWSVAVSPVDGSIYIAGETLSTKSGSGSFSTPGAFQTKFAGGKLTGDAFIAKFDNTGRTNIYMTYLGGKEDDGAFSVAVNAAGNAFVTGFTDSQNFPTANALFPEIGGKANKQTKLFPVDAFVAELNTTGSGLVYSTYLGGSGEDSGISIAVDSDDNAYVTGFTTSKNFPLESPLQNLLAGTQNAFVAEIAADDAALLFSTYFGGTKTDEGEGIAVDGDGYIYVTGFTGSSDFPTFNPQFPLLNNGVKERAGGKKSINDAFVSKLMPSGAGYVYSTYLGGTNNDLGLGVAFDNLGNTYVVGSSSSSDFPNVNLLTGTNTAGLSSHIAGKRATVDTDAFLTKFDTNGAIIYSALFGGKTNDTAYGVAVDASDEAFVVGATASTDFPTFEPETAGVLLSTNKSGKYDAFVTAFNADASAVLYSVCIGGKDNDYGYGIAVDSTTNVYVVGQTSSSDFPATNNVLGVAAFQPKHGGNDDGFITKILAP
jgi:Beta-propeller repeat